MITGAVIAIVSFIIGAAFMLAVGLFLFKVQ